MPNKLSIFRQELKRRKVVRVISVYAAASFVIIELVDIVAPNLGLPAWTFNLVLILLCIGFIIAVILSWIYDIHPEGGIVKTEPAQKVKTEDIPKPSISWKIASYISFIVILVMLSILLYPKIIKPDKFKSIRDEDGRISVAVMPFQNMTNDTLMDIWQAGIQNELITGLSDSEELSVRQLETTLDLLKGIDRANYATLAPSLAGDVSRKLNANTYISGTIKTAGNRIRINTQLVDSHTEEIYKTYVVDGNSEADVLFLTDSLSEMIKNFLQIKVLEKDVKPDLQNINVKSAEAYRHFILGMESDYANNRRAAIEYFKKAIEADQSFISAYIALIRTSSNLGLHEDAKEWLEKAMDFYDNLPILQQYRLDSYVAGYEKDMQEVIRIKKQIVELEPYSRREWHSLGWAYDEVHQYQNAINAYEKALEIDRQWGGGWTWARPYIQLGMDYHRIGNHTREKEIFELGLETIPNSEEIFHHQAICALSQGDTVAGESYIAKARNLVEDRFSEAQITYGIGTIYASAGLFEKAEMYHLQAFEMNSQNLSSINNLAWFLIENDINLDEGMELMEPIMKETTDNPNWLDTWGWGLFKQGKLEESLTALKQSWDLLPRYDHDIYLHIQEVEQAVASRLQ